MQILCFHYKNNPISCLKTKFISKQFVLCFHDFLWLFNFQSFGEFFLFLEWVSLVEGWGNVIYNSQIQTAVKSTGSLVKRYHFEREERERERDRWGSCMPKATARSQHYLQLVSWDSWWWRAWWPMCLRSVHPMKHMCRALLQLET